MTKLHESFLGTVFQVPQFNSINNVIAFINQPHKLNLIVFGKIYIKQNISEIALKFYPN